MRLFPVFIKRVVAAASGVLFGEDDQVAMADSVGDLSAEVPEVVEFSDPLGAEPSVEEALGLASSPDAGVANDDSVVVADTVAGVWAPVEVFGAAESPVAVLSGTETVAAAETTQPTLQADDTLRTSELASIDLDGWQCPRSTTPDADKWGDAWVDEQTGQTGVNHGNESPLNIVNTVVRRRFAFLKMDLRSLTGVTGRNVAGSGLTLFVVNSSALLAVNLTLFFERRSDDASPFTESTINWTNRPTGLTALFSKTLAVPAAQSGLLTVPLAKADVDALLGHYVCVRIESDSTTTSVSARSREAATAADRPTMTLKLQRLT